MRESNGWCRQARGRVGRQEAGVNELVVKSVAKGFEDGTGLGNVEDGALNGGEDFKVGEVGYLVKDRGLVGKMGVDADFAKVGREKRKEKKKRKERKRVKR